MKETFGYSKELDSKLRGKFSGLKEEISDNGFSDRVMRNLPAERTPVERTPLWQYAIYAAAFVSSIVLINSFEISFSLSSLTEFLKDFTDSFNKGIAGFLNAINSIFTNIYFYIISFVAVMLFALRYIRNFVLS